MPIRVKLAVGLAVPIGCLLLFAVGQIREAHQRAVEAREDAELAVSVAGVDSLLAGLQQERNLTGTYLRDSGLPPNIEVRTLAQARPITDEALESFTDTLATQSADVRRAYRPALQAINGRDDSVAGLAAIRARVDGYQGERSMTMTDPISEEVFDAYNALIDQLFAANTTVSGQFEDADLRRGVELIRLAVNQRDAISQLVRAALVAGIAADSGALNTTAEISEISMLHSTIGANDARIRSTATGPYRPLARQLYTSIEVTRLPETLRQALDTGVIDLAAVVDDLGPSDTLDFDYRTFSESVADEMRSHATSLTRTAQNRLYIYLLAGIPTTTAAIVVAWLVAGSITDPLAALTAQADDMARIHLPHAVREVLTTPPGENVAIPHLRPIEVRTRDEVADVADALNALQRAAIDLAVEQAVLRRNITASMVNLSRRNQNLVGRQLDYITELERNETDPDTLAALYRLDHLATRIRRNAESLLRLAGVEPPRSWATPLKVTDVIRAALGEVEDYQRVVVPPVDPVSVLGSAAADVTHVLAELVENALTYSDDEVHVQGHLEAGGYTISVIDAGPGLAADDRERANRRLAGAESFAVAPSKYLGHYVAGHIAARHNITITLRNRREHFDGPQTGLIAAVHLPRSLLGNWQTPTPPPPTGH